MEERSSENEEVPYGVHIPYFVAESVKYGSHGVNHSSGNQHEELLARQSRCNILVGKYDAPAGRHVADHGRNGEFFQINQIQKNDLVEIH